jgi:hypothetical protein
VGDALDFGGAPFGFVGWSDYFESRSFPNLHNLEEHSMLKEELESLKHELEVYHLRLTALLGDFVVAFQGSSHSRPLPSLLIIVCGTISSIAALRNRWRFMIDEVNQA